MSEFDGYDFAPQWTDFNECTPNRNEEGDEYFDRINQAHETVSSIPRRSTRLRLREKVNTKNADVSALYLDTSQCVNLNESEVEATFMNDIDKIRMTPIKIISPRTKNKDPIVMQELSVNEVLTNAIKGLEIASSKSRSCKKSQVLNATVCPSSTTNVKIGSAQRKIRVSRSMQFHSSNSSTGKTPAAKLTTIPRGKNNILSKNEISVDSNELVQYPIQTIIDATDQEIKSTKSGKISGKSCDSEALIGENTQNKFKTPRKSLKSVSTNSLAIEKPNTTSKIIKTPKLKYPIESQIITTEHDNTNQKVIKNQMKIPIVLLEPMDDATLEKYKTHMESEKTISPVKENVPTETEANYQTTVEQHIDTSIQSEKVESLVEQLTPNTSIEQKGTQLHPIDENVQQPNGTNININNDFQNNENFENELDTINAFQVHHANNAKHRNCRNSKPTFITNPARRRSSITNRRRRSNKYISLAEAVSTFQRSTPIRFHTVRSKPGPTQRVKQQATTKNTIPMSPALVSKTRVRRNVVLSQAEREELEIKNMRKNRVHANPIRPKILAAPETLKSVPKKPITVPKPFKLSGKPKPPPPAEPSTSTAPVTVAPSSCHPVNTRVKRIMTLAPSEDSQTLENQEIRDFGIPTVDKFCDSRHDTKKKTIRPQPFSMDERQKQFLNKKKEKLELLQNQEAKKLQFEFHARPVPTAVKKNTAVHTIKEKSQKATVSNVQVVPFSFEERNKLIAKKKEELRKKIEEEERKARIFHANPAPAFKPVAIRSVSRENLKTEAKTKSFENLRNDTKINKCIGGISRGKSADCLKSSVKTISRNQSTENLKTIKHMNSMSNIINKQNDLKIRTNSTERIDNQENVTPNIPISKSTNNSSMPILKPKLKTLPIELHSDKRARIRREFDEKIRMKMEQEEQQRRIEQEKRIAREQAEIISLRRKAEPKARPMPVYKPIVLAKSNKPLTEAESPVWAKMKR